MTEIKGMGWRRSIPKLFKNFLLTSRTGAANSSVDLSPKMPPVYDQGNTSSCTGNGVAACVEYLRLCQGLRDFTPSRLFLYYNGRTYENTSNSDAGAEIADVVKGVQQFGYCHEDVWPFIETKVTVSPDQSCYLDAKKHNVFNVNDVAQDLNHMKYILEHHGPIIFGSTLYASFLSKSVEENGMVPMPNPREKVLGGHCMVIVGFDDETQRFKVRSSWGKNWGAEGYCFMPYEYILNKDLTDDCHVLWAVKEIR